MREPSGPFPKTENLGPDNESIDNIDDMQVSSSDIKKQLLKLNIFKSSGPDGVPGSSKVVEIASLRQ